MELNLIGCPWCNSVPKITRHVVGFWVISCESKKCLVRPKCSFGSRDLNETIEVWNVRKDMRDLLEYVVDIELETNK